MRRRATEKGIAAKPSLTDARILRRVYALIVKLLNALIPNPVGTELDADCLVKIELPTRPMTGSFVLKKRGLEDGLIKQTDSD